MQLAIGFEEYIHWCLCLLFFVWFAFEAIDASTATSPQV